MSWNPDAVESRPPVRRPFPRAAVVLLVALVVLSARSHTSSPLAVAILTPIDASGQERAPQADIQTDQSIRRARYVAVSLNNLPNPSDSIRAPGTSPPIRLDLFDDVSAVVEFERFDTNASGTTWVGRAFWPSACSFQSCRSSPSSRCAPSPASRARTSTDLERIPSRTGADLRLRCRRLQPAAWP